MTKFSPGDKVTHSAHFLSKVKFASSTWPIFGRQGTVLGYFDSDKVKFRWDDCEQTLCHEQTWFLAKESDLQLTKDVTPPKAGDRVSYSRTFLDKFAVGISNPDLQTKSGVAGKLKGSYASVSWQDDSGSSTVRLEHLVNIYSAVFCNEEEILEMAKPKKKKNSPLADLKKTQKKDSEKEENDMAKTETPKAEKTDKTPDAGNGKAEKARKTRGPSRPTMEVLAPKLETAEKRFNGINKRVSNWVAQGEHGEKIQLIQGNMTVAKTAFDAVLAGLRALPVEFKPPRKHGRSGVVIGDKVFIKEDRRPLYDGAFEKAAIDAIWVVKDVKTFGEKTNKSKRLLCEVALNDGQLIRSSFPSGDVKNVETETPAVAPEATATPPVVAPSAEAVA